MDFLHIEVWDQYIKGWRHADIGRYKFTRKEIKESMSKYRVIGDHFRVYGKFINI